MDQSSVKEVEKRTYMSYHQDGLLDIFLGVYVLLFGSGFLLSTFPDFSTWFVIPAIFPAIMGPVWVSVKRRVTMPRIGYVKFRNRGAKRLLAVLIGLVVFGLFTFTLFVFASSESWMLALRNLIISNGVIIIGVAAAAIASLFAYTLGLTRLYAYGLGALALLLSTHYTVIPFAYSLLAIGFGIVGSGCVLLTRFIRKYPLPRGDRTSAQTPS